VKTIKAPRFDLVKLMELHEARPEDAGKAVKAGEPAVEPLAGSGGRL
jgi:hypothetical protein